ncbi:hypothetical protein VU06_02925 [Desulfobulbus sp. F3]|nr:hypothetical protein [Desulfobulbus sp. F3]
MRTILIGGALEFSFLQQGNSDCLLRTIRNGGCEHTSCIRHNVSKGKKSFAPAPAKPDF